MRYSTLFFDLDDTLYRSGNGLWDQIRQRMSQYMYERLGLSWEEIPLLRQTYYENYGTTLRGLQQHYNVDADDFLAYVHDLPLRDFLQPDLKLRKFLLSLPQKRWIFTNADADHARRVTEILMVEDCFEGIIDIKILGFACKPELVAYHRALEIAGGVKPEVSVLLDDSATNLIGASRAGLATVLVGSGETSSEIDYAIPNLFSLSAVLPELWNGVGTPLEYQPKTESAGDKDGS